MNRDKGTNWIKVRLKTLGDLRIAWQKTWCWQNPYIPGLFPPADRVIIPYLGKTVSVKELDIDSCRVIYELKDPGGLIVLPEWIDQILPDDSVPPSGWHKRGRGETWVELVEDRALQLGHCASIPTPSPVRFHTLRLVETEVRTELNKKPRLSARSEKRGLRPSSAKPSNSVVDSPSYPFDISTQFIFHCQRWPTKTTGNK